MTGFAAGVVVGIALAAIVVLLVTSRPRYVRRRELADVYRRAGSPPGDGAERLRRPR